LFLFAKQANPNQSNRRPTVQSYSPPLVFPGLGLNIVPIITYEALLAQVWFSSYKIDRLLLSINIQLILIQQPSPNKEIIGKSNI
jgi:hypothetical protein